MEVLSSRTIIVTGDFDRTRSFYEDTLGLRVYREYGSGPAVTGVVFFLGGGFLELTAGPGTAGPGTTGAAIAEPATAACGAVKLWMQVPDVAAEEERLRAAEVKITKPAERMPWGLIELWMDGPDGIEIRLIEVPPDHPLRRRVG